MRNRLLLWAIAGVLMGSSCTATPPVPAQSGDRKLVLLTRDGCVTSSTMRNSLDVALRAMNRQDGYLVVDQGTLPPTDFRVGYPTPTLLYHNQDVFGLSQPKPPFPEPT